LPEVRQAVLRETEGRLGRNSTVSRIAEQLGFALRQRHPGAVDADSLRNAANSFIYADPVTLPSSGPASILTRRVHNFSRVFTGAFLQALGNMVQSLRESPTADDILQASRDMGQLLVAAVQSAPVRTDYFLAVAAQLLKEEARLFRGKYQEAIRTALTARSLITVRALAARPRIELPSRTAAMGGLEAGVAEPIVVEREAAPEIAELEPSLISRPEAAWITLEGDFFGLPRVEVVALAPGEALPEAGVLPVVEEAGVEREIPVAAAPSRPRRAVEAFVETLVQQGKVARPDVRERGLSIFERRAQRRVTHWLVRRDDQYELRRLRFDCVP
jgi:hypothetical protein